MSKFQVGEKASYSKIISEKDVRDFAQISGDNNPLHLDEQYAAQSRFGKCIVHGILVSGLISKVIGTDLPGEGTIYLSQTLKFLKPVYVGENVTAEVTVTKIDTEKSRMTLETKVYNADRECVLSGEALVIPPAD